MRKLLFARLLTLTLLSITFLSSQWQLLSQIPSPLPSKSFIVSSVVNNTANKQIVEKETECDNPITQAAMNYCANLSAQAADKELNRVYRQLRKKIKGTKGEQKLINAQLAWIKFRDSDCDFAISPYQGGSIVPLIYANCLERNTKQRTEELNSYLAYPPI